MLHKLRDMNYQELRDFICSKKPRYNAAFKPLMERISTKGDASGKGDFSTLGPFYQTYMYAYIIGLRLGEKTPLNCKEKTEFAPISNWKPSQIRDFILITLFNRSEIIESGANWIGLENGSEDYIKLFSTMLIQEMEEYANTGLIYLQNKWDNENIIFTSPFVFVDILKELPYNNESTLPLEK